MGHYGKDDEPETYDRQCTRVRSVLGFRSDWGSAAMAINYSIFLLKGLTAGRQSIHVNELTPIGQGR